MKETLYSRLKHAWNAFFDRDSLDYFYNDVEGPVYSYNPSRLRLTPGTERTIINSIFNRIAIDAASISIQHVRLDDNGRFIEVIDSGLNNCLNLEANIDQTGR